jgi:release factor glutamine methyltransferase
MANNSLREILQKSISIKEEQAFKQDIYYLAQRVFSYTLEELFINEDKIIDDTLFNDYLKRYLNNEPLYYILNEAPFYGRMFYVDSNVLIPRNETEELVYYVLNRLKKRNEEQFSILEVGSGSGCIAITLDLELQNSKVTSVDISPQALLVANKNNQLLSADVKFLQSDCLDEIVKLNKKYDVFVSNPPYIDKDSFVEESVLKYEPHLALFCEDKGLAIYKKIFKDLDKVLYPSSFAIFEISPEQVEGLTKIVKEYLPNYKITFIKDINQFTRFLVLEN